MTMMMGDGWISSLYLPRIFEKREWERGKKPEKLNQIRETIHTEHTHLKSH